MVLTYKKERFEDIMGELPELFYAHWDEAESDKDQIPLEVDWLKYIKAEALGKLHIVAARAEGKLVGYVFLYVDTTSQNKRTIKAASDLVYISPEYRKGTEGWKLIDEAKKMARDLGAKKLYIVHKSKSGLGPLLVRKGFNPEEETHSCLL
jgi:N-acetylglutamate synthase-like GNAT family acetyltransferase